MTDMIDDGIKIATYDTILEPWAGLVEHYFGDEWGELVRDLYQLAHTASDTNDEISLTTFGWLLDELKGSADAGWYDLGNDEIDVAQRVLRRQWFGTLQSIVRSRFVINEATLHVWQKWVNDTFPDWMRPQPGDEQVQPIEDPEYREYLRLREKFEVADESQESSEG